METLWGAKRAPEVYSQERARGREGRDKQTSTLGAHTVKKNHHNIWLWKQEQPNFIIPYNQQVLKSGILKTRGVGSERRQDDKQPLETQDKNSSLKKA